MKSAAATPSSSALCASIGPGTDIANGVDAGDAGLEIMADFDLAALVGRDACLVEREAFGVGTAADGDEHAIGFDAFGRA